MSITWTRNHSHVTVAGDTCYVSSTGCRVYGREVASRRTTRTVRRYIAVAADGTEIAVTTRLSDAQAAADAHQPELTPELGKQVRFRPGFSAALDGLVFEMTAGPEGWLGYVAHDGKQVVHLRRRTGGRWNERTAYLSDLLPA